MVSILEDRGRLCPLTPVGVDNLGEFLPLERSANASFPSYSASDTPETRKGGAHRWNSCVFYLPLGLDHTSQAPRATS